MDVEKSGVATIEELAAFDTVQRWFEGWAGQWGAELTPSEKSQKLGVLLRFSQAVDKTPDEMIRTCVLTTKEGVRKISIKGRREYWEKIREVQTNDSSRSANVLRSFFIHNGIMMQADVRPTEETAASD